MGKPRGRRRPHLRHRVEGTVNGPAIRLPEGRVIPLGDGVTPVGRSPQMAIRLTDPTVSGLHAELVRRGPYVYVEDFGLSRNGTWVNGRPVGKRLLMDGDRIRFGRAVCRISVPAVPGDQPGTRMAVTARQCAVLEVLCRSVTSEAAFIEPASVATIARELGVSRTVVRVHLDRVAVGLSLPDGAGLSRIANEAVERGLIGNIRYRPATATMPGDQGR